MVTANAFDALTEEPDYTSRCSGHHDEIRERAEAILQTEIDFIPNASFGRCDHEAEDLTLKSLARLAGTDEAAGYPRELPAHLAVLCEAAVLTAEEERSLFRAMNYAKYRADILRSQLDPEVPDLQLVEHVEALLRMAHAIRDRILRANMRLVLSIVRKHVTPQYSFDELLSDGIDTLIKAVDKFDFGRGFRFSTYAHRAITRTAYRQISARQAASRRLIDAMDEAAAWQLEDSERGRVSPAVWTQLREMLDNMLSCLDPRERFIVRRRYGMGRTPKSATFQAMADKLGISKERVRQLENRAVGRLKTMAAEQGMSDTLKV